jgi:CTP synthase (UTP-ammonia lyase)
VIAIVGDRNPLYLTHEATDSAFARLSVETRWVPTPTLLDDPSQLSEYRGVLIAPGSPYVSTEGALAAIRYARENGIPLLGTCGGFQHVIMEFARDVAGMAGADHAEMHPDAGVLVVVPLTCSLVGQQHPVEIRPGTLAADLYGVTEAVEPFFCSFGLNLQYRAPLEKAGLCFSGFDRDGEPRILELPGHPFFLATLYVPQVAIRDRGPHPVLVGFLNAAQKSADSARR